MRTVPRTLGLQSEHLSQQIIPAHGRNSVCTSSTLHLWQMMEAFNLSLSDPRRCNCFALDEAIQHGLGMCSITIFVLSFNRVAKQMLYISICSKRVDFWRHSTSAKMLRFCGVRR